jgi:hypothetical protein
MFSNDARLEKEMIEITCARDKRGLHLGAEPVHILMARFDKS